MHLQLHINSIYIYIHKYIRDEYWMLYVKIVSWKKRGSCFFCAYARCCFVEQESLPKAGLPLVEEYGTFLSHFFESSTRQPKIKQRI